MVEFDSWLLRLRGYRWLNLVVANLRILIGFAFLPAGLKKVLGQPFTDPNTVGIFHEFLHVFYATGGFYRFVGFVQLLAAVLLMTQRFATAGAFLIAPVLGAITVLCWSTTRLPTIVVTTLMSIGVTGLLLWDFHSWKALFRRQDLGCQVSIPPLAPVIDRRLWQGCGGTILLAYLFACLVQGEIYRPRGLELATPAFYVLPAIALLPILTWWIDRYRLRRRG